MSAFANRCSYTVRALTQLMFDFWDSYKPRRLRFETTLNQLTIEFSKKY